MLHYEISGKGNENLFLLHGFMENLTIWEDLEAHLSSEFRLIKLDLPGHGKSPIYGETHAMEQMAEKVKDVANFLKITNFHLLGHSMGGYVSLAFAEKFPENLKSLTLFFSTFFEDDAEKKEIRKRSLKIIDGNFNLFVNNSIPALFNEHEMESMEGRIDLAKKIALSTEKKAVKAAINGMIARTDKLKTIESFERKILLISGKHDHAVNSVKTLNAVPDKKNIKSYLVDCGHNGHWEKPEICAAIINTELLNTMI